MMITVNEYWRYPVAWPKELKWPREYDPSKEPNHPYYWQAYSNACLWLSQAARGEVPHGGMQPGDPKPPMTDYTVAERPGRND